MHRVRIPSILGLLLLLVGVFNGVVLIQNHQIIKTEAINSSAPKNVRVTNIDEKSFTVSWTTDLDSSGYVIWGPAANKIYNTVLEDNSAPSKIHQVNISNLKTSQLYFFKINSGGGTFDNSGIPWSVNTGIELEGKKNHGFISGSVQSALGRPIPNALVFATPAGGATLSSKTIENGSFSISLSNARKKDLNDILILNDKTTIEIIVIPPSLQLASAVANLESSNSLPPIQTGQTYDFTSLAPVQQVQVPSAEIIIPNNL
jgi:hypothetical protein